MRDQRRRKDSGRRMVSASELAQMGVCERLVIFEKCYGKRRNTVQQQAIQRGLEAHRRFYRDGKLSASVMGLFVLVIRIARGMRQAARALVQSIRRGIARLVKREGQGDDA